MANDTLKRLEEIEVEFSDLPMGAAADKRWLCARLRDALAVIAAVRVFDSAPTMFTMPFLGAGQPRSYDEAALAAYRRLFGEEESRG